MGGEVLVDEAEVGEEADEGSGVTGEEVGVCAASDAGDINVGRKNGASEVDAAA